MKMRKAGILLPIFSLPGKYGIGNFGKEAYDFVDFLSACGQSYWQVLPLGPTGFGDSPYQSLSVYAGNPYFISPDMLKENGLLTEKDCREHMTPHGKINYALLYETRYVLFGKAFERFRIKPPSDFADFKLKNKFWLDSYCLFMSAKEQNGYKGAPDFWAFLQYCFFRQWYALKAYANGKGIQIIGDRPIYSALDSAEVWANPRLFQLDGNLMPTAVAGVPPDAFCDDGQLWGNPLYDWEQLKKDGFAFWLDSFDFTFQLFDAVRIDHFRGFVAYYSVPAGSATAKGGEWVDAPCKEFFSALKARYGTEKIIAEDLGTLDGKVKEMLAFCGFPGMKVFQFAFGEDDSMYLPENYPENCVAYTGTHDNMPTKHWLKTLKPDERARLKKSVKRQPRESGTAACIRSVMNSCANTVIIPIQDYMESGKEARVNFPSTTGGNWSWRLTDYDTPERREHIRFLTKNGGRTE